MYTTQNIFVLYYVYISVKEGIFMATKKAASTKKKTTAKKTAASKTTVRTVSAEKVEAPKKETAAAKPTTTKRSSAKLPSNIINIIFAELIGTFVLTLVALTTFKDGGGGALAVGFTLVLLVMSIGAVSGSHVNPAVTFGLWTMRKLKTILLPFYWGAQFIGAMLAVIVTNWVTGGSINFGFSGFSSMNWSIFGIELVGTAIFLFGLAAVLSREETCNTGKALGVGLALAVGILTSGYLLSTAKTQAIADYQSKAASSASNKVEIPHVAYVKGASLNPAVALAMTDSTEKELTTGSAGSNEVVNSRFSLESLVGALAGAAVGANLYVLVAGRQKKD